MKYNKRLIILAALFLSFAMFVRFASAQKEKPSGKQAALTVGPNPKPRETTAKDKGPRSVGIISIVKAGEPTIPPSKTQTIDPPKTIPKSKTGETTDNRVAVDEDFWMYFCVSSGSPLLDTVDVKAYFATLDPDNGPSTGGEVGAPVLADGADYFFGSDTIPIVPLCTPGGSRGQLRLKVTSEFFNTDYNIGFEGILLQVSKRDGDVDCVYYIKVRPPVGKESAPPKIQPTQ